MTDPNRKELELLTLKCSRDVHDSIHRIFRARGVNNSWSLTEYFLTKPLVRATISGSIDDLIDSADPPQVYFPFLERRLARLHFLLDIRDYLQNPNRLRDEINVRDPLEMLRQMPLTANIEDVHKELLGDVETSPLGITTIGKRLASNWLNRSGIIPPAKYVRHPIWAKRTASEVTRHLWGNGPMGIDRSEIDRSEWVEYSLNDHFWVLAAKTIDTTVFASYAVPIASERLFFGYVVVQFPESLVKAPHVNGFAACPDDPASVPLFGELQRAIDVERYQRILTLAFNAQREKDLKDLLGGTPPPTVQRVAEFVKKDTYFFTNEEKIDQPRSIEEAVIWIWRKRHDRLIDRSCEATALDAVKRTLILAEYMAAAPEMVKAIEQIMTLNLVKKDEMSGNKPLDSLPAALIVGGPGSGKDKASQLVAVFTDHYTFERVRTYNMAGLRPQFLIGPLLQGIGIPYPLWKGGVTFEGQGARMGVSGIMPAANSPKDRPPVETVILDELNSLHIDEQGILLRIIENAEITPLFSQEPSRVALLCIGVMNEDPDLLAKEDAAGVSQASSDMFGRIMGTVVDELFRKARRLRPDLYRRLHRGGVVRLPSLSERRGDIPFLFAKFVRKTDPEARTTFDADDRLMEGDLPWSGNIRELQGLAKIALQVAKENRTTPSGTTVRITRDDVNEGLKRNDSLPKVKR